MNNCIFCKIIDRQTPASFVYEDRWTLAFMNQRQANKGHVLVVPKKHIATIFDLPQTYLYPLISNVAKISKAVQNQCRSEGINIWQSNGAVAGQEIFHVHFHILPRYADDGLFNIYPHTPPVEARQKLDEIAIQIKTGLKEN